mgnify:CR=1 FL=1
MRRDEEMKKIRLKDINLRYNSMKKMFIIIIWAINNATIFTTVSEQFFSFEEFKLNVCTRNQ